MFPPADEISLLLVDDDIATLDLLSAALSKEGYVVSQADSFEVAFEILRDQGFESFDLVISDYWMPGKNGLELVKRIAAEDPTLSVILMTADEERAIVEGLLRSGGCDFLRKPIDMKAFGPRVRVAADRTHRLRALQTTASEASALGESQRLFLERHLRRAWPDIEFFYSSKSQASGDFLSAFKIEENSRVLLASDGSGHDLSSAFQSNYFHGLARGMIRKGGSLEELLEYFNELMLHNWNDDDIGSSLAACALNFDFENRTISYLNAGFPQPMAAGINGFADILGSPLATFPLGWFADSYDAESCSMPDGYLYLWTDGLGHLAQSLNLDPLALACRLLDKDRSSDFIIVRATDDVAVVRLCLANEKEKPRVPIVSLEIPGDTVSEIDQWQEYFENSLRIVLEEIGIETLSEILLCLREGVINALKHGCQGLSEEKVLVQISLSPDRRELHATIKDSGEGHSFNPSSYNEKASQQLSPHYGGLFMIDTIPQVSEVVERGSRVNMQFCLDPAQN